MAKSDAFDLDRLTAGGGICWVTVTSRGGATGYTLDSEELNKLIAGCNKLVYELAFGEMRDYPAEYCDEMGRLGKKLEEIRKLVQEGHR
jgi:hypothetical protein